MNHQKETLFFAVLTLLVQSAPAAEAATVPQWSVHEITLEAERTFENPKVQVKKADQNEKHPTVYRKIFQLV